MNKMTPIPPAGPRYRQIMATLCERVETGVYALDASLPTESELCDEFGASRHTVREALRGLVEQGMVQRRQGSGSVVVATRPQARYQLSLSSLAELRQYSLSTHYQFLSLETIVLNELRAVQVGGKAGETWNLMKGVRRIEEGGKLVCCLHSYVPGRLTPFVRDLQDCRGPFYEHLAHCSGDEIVEAEQDIRGEPMNADIASHLGCEVGTMAICALRRYVGRKGPVISSFNWHVAEDFSFRLRISKNR